MNEEWYAAAKSWGDIAKIGWPKNNIDTYESDTMNKIISDFVASMGVQSEPFTTSAPTAVIDFSAEIEPPFIHHSNIKWEDFGISVKGKRMRTGVIRSGMLSFRHSAVRIGDDERSITLTYYVPEFTNALPYYVYEDESVVIRIDIEEPPF